MFHHQLDKSDPCVFCRHRSFILRFLTLKLFHLLEYVIECQVGPKFVLSCLISMCNLRFGEIRAPTKQFFICLEIQMGCG